MHIHYDVRVCSVQVHRSSRGEQQTKVDVSGTLDAQMAAKLLIEGITSQPSHTGKHLLYNRKF